MTPLAYSEEVEEVEDGVPRDASFGCAHAAALRPGVRPMAPLPGTSTGSGTGALVGGPARFTRNGDLEGPSAVPRPLRAIALTVRDVEVLGYLAEGWTTAEIAHALAYAESTIKKEVHLIVHHMGARNRTHAVAMAVRGALI